MRVENTILLQGPLSRNRKILELRAGDTVSARILERLDGKRAVLNLHGNKITALFEGGLPPNDSITLKIIFKNSDKIIFQAPRNDEGGSLPRMGAHLGIPLPLLSQTLLHGDPRTVAELLFVVHDKNDGEASRRHRHPREAAKSLQSVAEGLISLTPDIASFVNSFDYLIIEDRDAEIVAASKAAGALFYAAFELGDELVELTARQQGDCVEAILYCADKSLSNALQSRLHEFGKRLHEGGVAISLSVLTHRELFDLLLNEFAKNTDKNIVDYTA